MTDWIPVSERLPHDHGIYLVTAIHENGSRTVLFALFWMQDGNSNIVDVIAWQPMPEPYQPPIATPTNIP